MWRKMEESVSFLLWSPGSFSGGDILTWKKVSEAEPAMVPLESVLLVVTGGACSLPAMWPGMERGMTSITPP